MVTLDDVDIERAVQIEPPASHVQQLAVVPNILITWSIEKPPTRSQAQILHDFRTLILQMDAAHGGKEIHIFRKCFA